MGGGGGVEEAAGGGKVAELGVEVDEAVEDVRSGSKSRGEEVGVHGAEATEQRSPSGSGSEAFEEGGVAVGDAGEIEGQIGDMFSHSAMRLCIPLSKG